MAAPRDELVLHCLELMAPLGVPPARRMFGGHGVDVDDLFIALIAYGRLYLKADVATRSLFEAAGCEPFTYEAKGKAQSVSLSYFSAPDEAMESPDQMQPWARLALESALRARRPAPSATAHKARAASARKKAPGRKA